MLFKDLLGLPYDRRSGLVCLEAVCRELPNIPIDVVEQLLVDHGRKADHQHFYGHIDLASIVWNQIEASASALSAASVLPDFEGWTSNVASRAPEIRRAGWVAADARPEVREHWQREGTWMRAPIFLAGEIAKWGANLHLAEGHTRLGLLRGLLRENMLPAAGKHQAWIGTVSGGLAF